jgi:hypothetical protein
VAAAAAAASAAAVVACAAAAAVSWEHLQLMPWRAAKCSTILSLLLLLLRSLLVLSS